MEKPFEISKEQLLKAKTYMPLRDKDEIAKLIAESCLVPIDRYGSETERKLSLPCVMKEDYMIKAIMEGSTLLNYYFGIEIEKDNDGNLTPEIYDKYFSVNPLNKIERFKTDSETREIAFGLLADFKELKNMINCEIYNRKTNYNDGFNRIGKAIETYLTPEAIKDLTTWAKENFTAIQGLIDNAEKKRNIAKKETEKITEIKTKGEEKTSKGSKAK